MLNFMPVLASGGASTVTRSKRFPGRDLLKVSRPVRLEFRGSDRGGLNNGRQCFGEVFWENPEAL